MGQGERFDVRDNINGNSSEIQEFTTLGSTFLHSKNSMGGSGSIQWEKYKRSEAGKLIMVGNSNGYSSIKHKRLTDMAAIKMIIFLADFLGIPLFITTFLLSIGDVKAVVLFIIAVVYGIARTVVYIIKQIQEIKLRNIRIRERDFEVDEKIENADHEKDL
jgi:hypothetical protein